VCGVCVCGVCVVCMCGVCVVCMCGVCVWCVCVCMQPMETFLLIVCAKRHNRNRIFNLG